MLKHIRQPSGSNLCGQASVAMIAGITLEKSIAVFGKRSCTTTKDVIRALRALGISCGNGLVRLKKGEQKSSVCMVVLHFEGAPRSHGHWSVFYDGIYYDPASGVGDTYSKEVRETSYLPIERPHFD